MYKKKKCEWPNDTILEAQNVKVYLKNDDPQRKRYTRKQSFIRKMYL